MKKNIVISLLFFIAMFGLRTELKAMTITIPVNSTDGYVLILNFYNGDNDWASGIQNSITDYLRRTNKVFFLQNLYESTMDREKLRTDWWKHNIGNIGEKRPRVVVLIGDAGWILYRHYVPDSWKSIPVIIVPARSNIVRFEDFSHHIEIEGKKMIPLTETMKGFNAIGMAYGCYCKETIMMMRRIQPQIKRIALISDTRLASAFVRYKVHQVIKNDFKDLSYIEFQKKEIDTRQLLDAIKKFDYTTGVIFYSWFDNREADETIDYTRKMISAYSRVPIFTFSDYNIETDSSLSGGYFNSCEDAGLEIGRVIDRVYGNKLLPWGKVINIDHPRMYLNYLSLINKGIHPQILPKKAVYFDKPISFYAQYKYAIWISCFLLLTIFIIVLQYAWTQRRLHHEKEKEIMHLVRYKKLFDNMPIAYMRYSVRKSEGNKSIVYKLININAVGMKYFMEGKGRDNFGLVEQEIFMKKRENNIWNVANGSPSLYIEFYHEKTERHYDAYICPSEQTFFIDIFIIDKTDQVETFKKMMEYAKMNGRILGMLADTIIIFRKDYTVEMIMNYSDHNALASSPLLIGKKTSDFYVKGVTEQLNQAIDKAFWTHDVVTFDYNLKQNEDVFYFNVRLNMLSGTKVCCTIHEYTDMMLNQIQLEQAKNELEQLNHKLQMVLDTAMVIPWIADLTQRVITVGTTQYTFKEIIRLLHSNDISGYMALLKDIIVNNNSIIQTYNIRINYTGKGYQWYKARCAVGKRNREGKPITLIGSITNIEIQKQIEQTLIEAKEKAEESNRLKSAFLANMSHEIRTPLNAIVGFSNILATTEELSNDEKKEFSQNIKVNTELLLQLINDILDLAKIDAGTIEFVYQEDDFTGIIKDIATATRMRMTGNEVRFIVDDIPDSCITYTDRRRVSQVVNNFLTNAIKFTSHGYVMLGYKIVENGEMIFCYVKDTGTGISKEQQEKIFERFVKLDAFKQGTGLGLSICQTIILKMDGKIGVYSQPGEGSTFWFKLPLLKKAPK